MSVVSDGSEHTCFSGSLTTRTVCRGSFWVGCRGVVKGGGIWKEVDAREPWADGTGGGQSSVSVSKDIFCKKYSLETFS